MNCTCAGDQRFFDKSKKGVVNCKAQMNFPALFYLSLHYLRDFVCFV